MNKQTGIPIASEEFSRFVDSSEIFDKTNNLLKGYLTNWYNGSPETFVEDMRADLATVLGQYHFYNEFVSITKNFNFKPPIDTISCIIRITDKDDDCCPRYRAIFDDQLNVIDDTMEV